MAHPVEPHVLAGALVAVVMAASAASDTWANEVVVPFGNEFPVGTSASATDYDPAVSIAPDGRFGVVWMSNRDPLQDQHQSYWGVYGRRFSPSGLPLGPEFRANEGLPGLQRQPDVAYAADGSFVVTWMSQDVSGEPERTDAMVRAFDPDGHARGAEFPISAFPTGEEFGSTTTALDGGGFVVVWGSPGDDVSEYVDTDLFAQRLDADGELFGTAFRVNTTLGEESSPAVTARRDGGFVVAWTHVVAHTPTWVLSTLGQAFDANGEKVSPELLLGAPDAGKRKLPAVSADEDGAFVVAWGAGDYDDEFANPGARDVLVRMFAADGTPAADALRPHADPAGRQVAPGVAHTGEHGFVVVWEDGYGPAYDGDAPDRDGDAFGIFARLFDDHGEPTSPEFQVNTYTTGNQWFDAPPTRAVAADAEGNFIVAWVSNYEVVARRFCLFDSDEIVCGDADCRGAAGTTSDALVALQSAVALVQCPPCVCDVDGSGAVTVADALGLLRRASGLADASACPAC